MEQVLFRPRLLRAQTWKIAAELRLPGRRILNQNLHNCLQCEMNILRFTWEVAPVAVAYYRPLRRGVNS